LQGVAVPFLLPFLRRQLPSLNRIPAPKVPSIGHDRKRGAIRPPEHALDETFQLLEAADLTTAFEIPQAHRTINRGGGKEAAIRRQARSHHATHVPSET